MRFDLSVLLDPNKMRKYTFVFTLVHFVSASATVVVIEEEIPIKRRLLDVLIAFLILLFAESARGIALHIGSLCRQGTHMKSIKDYTIWYIL